MLSNPVLAVISLFVIVVRSGSSSANSVIPLHYSVQFCTDIQSGNEYYNGTVWIDFEVSEAVGQLELRAGSLEIEEVTLTKKEVAYGAQFNELPSGALVLELDDQLAKGSYQLKIVFNGNASDHDAMFKGSYQRDDDSTGYYLMSKPKKTDFYSVPCVFPHFGEELKATFSISVVHRDNLKAWSNMPLKNPPKPDDREHYVISSFQETPVMHVYDVGFFVADFGSLKIGNVTVVARHGILQSTQYVGSLGNDLVRIMDEHTAVDYSGPIPDFVYIVLPRELEVRDLTEFERMFVEEEYMMYDKNKNNYYQLAQIFERSSYKMMLQWLGNLIAPEEERLHQAFSNVYTYFNAEKVYPEERIMMIYQMDVLQKSLQINHENPSSILNMFWLIILDEKWRVVMRNLMKNRKPRTLTTAQLWSEAQALWPEDYNLPEGTTLETIFNQWMNSDDAPPTLNVQRLYSEGKVILSQNGSEKILPYNYATDYSHFNQLGPFQWLTSRNETVQFDGSDDHWLIMNKEEFGFYRVNYDEPNWRLIIQALRSNASSIHPFSRMQLVDDAFYFTKNDQLDITIFLELLTYLRGETFYISWYNVYEILTSGYFHETEAPSIIKTFLLHLIEPYYDSFASLDISTSTPRMELYIRAQISELVCWLGHEECFRQAQSRFQQAVTENTPVEPNWSEMIYCYGLQNASDDELEWLLTEQSENLSDAIAFWSCVDNKKHLRRVLEELVKRARSIQDILYFMWALDETGFEMLHSLLISDRDLVQLLDPTKIELVLLDLSRMTKSAKKLTLIDDLEIKLGLNMAEKGMGDPEINIWTKPEVADFIERYMNGFKD